jgi:hypothetical protein
VTSFFFAWTMRSRFPDALRPGVDILRVLEVEMEPKTVTDDLITMVRNSTSPEEKSMSTIIAGRFLNQADVLAATAALQQAGFPAERISSFYVNPPGQHDRYRLGGDHDQSVGAENTRKGAITGGAAGAVAGLVVSPVVGPIGPFLGAYVGSLMGGLAATKEKEMSADVDDDHPVEHHSGMVVAVALDLADPQQGAINALESVGGYDLEVAEGIIEASDWVDFDPLQPPRLIRASA